VQGSLSKVCARYRVMSELLLEKNLTKEAAAWDKRYWLRISNACNLKCIFCLDAEHHIGTFSPLDFIKHKIKKARDEGTTRLIVSGGEASIHPQFMEVIAYATSLGFEKVQTITNGRMFSYKSFADKAVEAGLNEATFSIHGHNAKLHDKLVAMPGAFDQALQGIRNLIDSQKVIINIDVCVNKQNYKHVEDIIKLFATYDIYEFDPLLQTSTVKVLRP